MMILGDRVYLLLFFNMLTLLFSLIPLHSYRTFSSQLASPSYFDALCGHTGLVLVALVRAYPEEDIS